MTLDPTVIASSVVAFLGTSAAAYERWRSNKAALITAGAEKDKAVNEAIIKGHAELVVIERDRADAWVKRYDELKSELSAYRDACHTKANADNALVMALTKENSEWRAKTDVTPILEKLKAQDGINSKVIIALDEIIRHLRRDRSADQVEAQPVKRATDPQ